jgi:hypothetical protein
VESGVPNTEATCIPSIKDFFDCFVTAFASFDAANVAELFATPGVALGRDGSIIALTTREDVLRYYQTALDHYRGNGCVSCQRLDLQVTDTGAKSALASVTWHLLRGDSSVLTSWRQSYSLSLTKDGPKIFASAMHAD